ncbi:MAG: hypothetical protein M3O22_04110, partial [Pseudomonadota bacterium]|nr:hypothetical protein [Pseudomonadota bacterium]
MEKRFAIRGFFTSLRGAAAAAFLWLASSSAFAATHADTAMTGPRKPAVTARTTGKAVKKKARKPVGYAFYVKARSLYANKKFSEAREALSRARIPEGRKGWLNTQLLRCQAAYDLEKMAEAAGLCHGLAQAVRNPHV